MSAKTSIYSRTWLPSPWQVVSWGLRQLGLVNRDSGDKLGVGRFVVMDNVEVIPKISSCQTAKLTEPNVGRCKIPSLADLRKLSLSDLQHPLHSHIHSRLPTSLRHNQCIPLRRRHQDPPNLPKSRQTHHLLLSIHRRHKPHTGPSQRPHNHPRHLDRQPENAA